MSVLGSSAPARCASLICNVARSSFSASCTCPSAIRAWARLVRMANVLGFASPNRCVQGLRIPRSSWAHSWNFPSTFSATPRLMRTFRVLGSSGPICTAASATTFRRYFSASLGLPSEPPALRPTCSACGRYRDDSAPSGGSPPPTRRGIPPQLCLLFP